MQRQLRILRLLTIARLRSAGWAPWLLLSGWLAIARVQEPRMLRRFGVHLIDDASWAGGLAVVLVVLLAVRRRPLRAAVLTNLVTLAAVSLVLAAATWLIDRGAWSMGAGARLLEAGAFVVAFGPLAITLSAGEHEAARGRWVATLVVLASLVACSMVAVALRSSPTGPVWLAATLNLAAASCWAARPRTP